MNANNRYNRQGSEESFLMKGNPMHKNAEQNLLRKKILNNKNSCKNVHKGYGILSQKQKKFPPIVPYSAKKSFSSSSSEAYKAYNKKDLAHNKIGSANEFHQNVIKESINSYNNSKIREYYKQLKENLNKIIKKEDQNKEEMYDYSGSSRKKEKTTMENDMTTENNSKISIFGKNDNILSVLRTKIERMKFDKEYQGCPEDLKEIIKDELLEAQVKLGRKPKKLNAGNMQNIKPLFLRKLENIQYLKYVNKILQFNQLGTVPIVVKSGDILLRLMNDSMETCKSDRYHIKFKI